MKIQMNKKYLEKINLLKKQFKNLKIKEQKK